MSICAHCGAEFSCAMADAAPGDKQPCWCMAAPSGLPVPAQGSGASCWCPACLKRRVAEAAARRGPSESSPEEQAREQHAPF